MTVITISRQFGSGGDDIARLVSQELGYRIFDKYMIQQAAREAGLSEQKAEDYVLDYSEDNYNTRSFFDLLLDRAPILPFTEYWPDDLTGKYSYTELAEQKEVSLKLVQKAVQCAYQMGNVVIVGRGGQALLKDLPNVFHVRVIAPIEMRRQQMKELLMQNQRVYSTDLEHRYEVQATEQLALRDAASADYIWRFYHARWDDPLLYHMLINTGKVRIDEAVRAVVQLVRAASPVAEQAA